MLQKWDDLLEDIATFDYVVGLHHMDTFVKVGDTVDEAQRREFLEKIKHIPAANELL